MTKNSCFRDFGAGRLCKVRAIVSSNSAFCGFAVHLHSGVARILSSSPRICGFACRFGVDRIERVTQNSCFRDFGPDRFCKVCLQTNQNSCFRDFGADRFCKVRLQTRIFSNFAAPTFLELLPQTRKNTYTQTDR